jgi:hypothetical protein
MHTNNRQPKSMYVLSENNIPFFNGFHHYSPYIDYSSINCVPQLAKKGVVVSDSPVPLGKANCPF